MHIAPMITDLAIMLLTAGIIGIVFKKLKLPVILGYILAGFLISPYFPMFFNVEDTDSINIWSEIGVIILLFHIGLEFNLQKLADIGSTAIITALIKMSGVMLIGYGFGHLIGLTPINCVFLGAMLSISSTAVIQKSFEETGTIGEKHTKLVMGTLIVEDVVSIFIMVVLSTVSVSQSISGNELIINLLMMICYLIVWLILGIFFLPTLLNKVIDLLTDEMLVVLSLGLCFGMAILAKTLGFSVELGAFLTGSLLAGTIHVHRVEKITRGIKDMFGAIFFLSVGMMVDPSIIITHWKSIIPIAAIAIVAKIIFAPIGMILSGQSLDTAIKSGFSLAPIGEFSFIIASLGISLKVMDEYLYPVIVSAAVLTTFLTPTLIKNAGKAVGIAEKFMPRKLLKAINKYTSASQIDNEEDQEWSAHIKQFFSKTVIYGVIMLVSAVAGTNLLEPVLEGMMSNVLAKICTCGIIFIVIGVFTPPMLNLHNQTFTALWLSKRTNRLPLIMLIIIKVALILGIAAVPINVLFKVHRLLLLTISVVIIILLGRSKFLATSYLQLETRFLRNLNERTIEREEKTGRKQEWLDEDMNILSFVVPKGAPYTKKPLSQLHWGRNHNIYIVKIKHNGKFLLLPHGKTVINTGDKVYAVGDLKSLENFRAMLEIDQDRRIRTLKEFMESDYPQVGNALSCCAIKISGEEDFAGQTIRNSRIMDKWHCLVLGIQKEGYPVMTPDANFLISKGDILWVIGANNKVGLLAAECLFNDYEEIG